MKVHNFLVLTLLLNFVTSSVGRCETREYEHINQASLRKFEKSILTKYDGEVVYSLRDIKTGKEISAVQGDKPVKPASVQKLITSYAALKELGGEYTFHTDFYHSEKNKVLVVKGYGDPAMTDERLYKAVDDLYRAGITKIEKLIIDDSSFTSMLPRSGINPYQAAQSAVTLNFNTVNVRGQLIGDRKVFSTTTFSPLDLKSKVVVGDAPGVSFSGDGNSVSLYVNKHHTMVEDNRSVDDPSGYFARALVGLMKLRGIEVPKTYSVERSLIAGEPVVVSNSKDLAGIIAEMNRYSSNFLAGQITYQLGRVGEGLFDYDKGLAVIARYSDGPVKIADGSGLSHENKLTASGLSKVIAKAMEDQAIAADFQASMSRYGRRGTLKRRELNFTGEDKIWAKTGTINGVSSIAGTMELKDKTLAAFVIISNGPSPKSESVSREDFIIRTFLAADISRSN